MDDDRVMHGMCIDDAYRVDRVLAERHGSKTELVTLDGAGPFVRKKLPLDRVNRSVWATLPACGCLRLPQMAATYELPDAFAAVYAYVPGETLSARMHQRNRLPAAEAVRIARDLSEAAAALHEHGIVHCDIAPSNIVLAADGAHLIDLGLARMLTDPAPARAEGLGTRGFASPEQCFDKPDARSDVYAIGRVLGFMLTGVRPDQEGYDALLADDRVVPPKFRAIIEQASAFDRDQRFVSVGALERALEESDKSDTRGPIVDVAGRQGFAAQHEDARRQPADQPPASDQAARHLANEPVDTAAPPSCRIAPLVRRTAVRDRRIIKFTLLALAVIAALTAIGIIVWTSVTPESSAAQQGMASPSKDSGDALFDAEAGTQGREDDGTAPATGGGTDGEMDGMAESLEIVEAWWEQDSTGYFAYVVGLRNTSGDTVYEYPAIYVTAYDDAGERINRTEQVLMEIAPGQTVYFSGLAGLDGNETASVEFEAGESSYGSYERQGAGDPSTFEASNISVTEDGLGGAAVTGDFTTTHIGGDARYATGTAVTVVFRDAEGEIVYAGTTFASLPEEGESSAFTLDLFPLPPAYDHMDVYIIPW